MLQIYVRSDVTDPVERVGLQNAVAEGIRPHSANDVENVIHCLRGQDLLEQLCLKQLNVALADVDDPTLTEQQLQRICPSPAAKRAFLYPP